MLALPGDLLAALAGVRSVGVITGAGVSAESGIPTYRGAGGLYDDEEEGDRTVEALSGPTLRRDPDRTWRVVADLARRSVAARPNPAHEALVRIENHVERFTLLTQNVDGLHRLAGSRSVIDIHGDVLDVRCMACDARDRLTPEALRSLHGAPRCAACGEVQRPDAVLFGEMLPAQKVARMSAAFLERPPDLVVVAGTTAMFPYIAEPVVHAARGGRLTVEVNPEPTFVTEVVRWSLRASAGDALPALADALISRSTERPA